MLEEVVSRNSMEEVPMNFDPPPSRTVDGVVNKTGSIVTTRNEKTHFTVILHVCCMGNGWQ